MSVSERSIAGTVMKIVHFHRTQEELEAALATAGPDDLHLLQPPEPDSEGSVSEQGEDATSAEFPTVHRPGRLWKHTSRIAGASGYEDDGHTDSQKWHKSAGGSNRAEELRTSAKQERVGTFLEQLSGRGFAHVKLSAAPLPDAPMDALPCITSRCPGKMEDVTMSAEGVEEAEKDEDEDEERCDVCARVIGLRDQAWDCDVCEQRLTCAPCYEHALKFQARPRDFAYVIPAAAAAVHRRISLDDESKAALCTGRPNDGYARIPGDKELFHWRGDSEGIITASNSAQASAVSSLRSRCLRLGANMVSHALQHTCKMIVPEMDDMWAALYHYEPGEPPSKLSEEDTALTNAWLLDGLTCPDESLLSAFHYFPKPAALHCEPHRDKGLLSTLLHPQDVEVHVGGEWVRADLDERGEPLPSNFALVLVGHTLEAASNGRFKAALHRIVNRGGSRTSLVAKIRAPLDAELDLRRALRFVASPPELEALGVLSLRSLLDRFTDATGSINAAPSVLPLPPAAAVADTMGVGAWTGCFELLSTELLVAIFAMLGVHELSRCARASRAMHATASHNRFWIAAAVRAQIDWATLSAADPHKLHRQLGQRLLTFEANEVMTLYLLWDDDYDTLPAEGEDEFVPQYVPVRIDQRTPLSVITEPFIEEKREELSAAGVVEVHHGKKNGRGRRENTQRVNPHMTAWHHQLKNEDVLAFSQEFYGD